ncbi:MAG: TRAP transporter substrate-binding protein DctP [Spirochaetes bacterium]|nr:TRAP transporter substrate-binding protein DctP [Spirochaetota bacterium]MBU0953977.1 TRAP transporter substrate-binding protein DctP [Spirochaetota bacterium]
MTGRKTAIISAAIFLLLAGALPLGAQTLRLQFGAAIPANSPWDIGIRQLASEWARISANKVLMQFPRSASSITQDEMVQRLSYQLNGALLENSGINILDSNMFYLAMPSVIQSEAEFLAAIEIATPLMAQKISDQFVVLGIAQGGWVYFFANKTIYTPSDLVGMRVGVNPDHEILIQQLQNLGARPVKATSTSLILQFNSNQLDVAYTSPLFVSTMWSQLRRSVSHMSALKISPFFGALVINKRDWDRIPDSLKPALQAAATSAVQKIAASSLSMEADAIRQMQNQGLTVNTVNPAQIQEWNSYFNGAQMQDTLRQSFDAQFMASINAAISLVRE